MEVFDYDKMLIQFNGCTFPFTVIKEGDNEHIISVVGLEAQLFDDENGDYTSHFARWIDEQITYFVTSAKDLMRPSKDILKEIYG